jgi:hypothetical protein
MSPDTVRCDRCKREPAIRVLGGVGVCRDCAPGKKPPQPVVSVIAETLRCVPVRTWDDMTARERNRHLCRRSYAIAKLSGFCPKCRRNRPEPGRVCCVGCQAKARGAA